MVRHAEAFKNLEPPPAGMRGADLDALTPGGEDQAQSLRAQLPGGPATYWASPTRRTRQTAELLAEGRPVRVDQSLRPLDEADSAEDAAVRARDVLDRVQAELQAGEHAVLVTHGDMGPMLLGEVRGTPPRERASAHALGTGEMVCLPAAVFE